MYRIYLDKNIFSYLRTDSKYSEFVEKLLKRKDVFCFFSSAHIEDIKQDNSEFRLSDLEYIEKYTKDNYLFFNPLTQNISIVNATPSEVFESKQPDLENTISLPHFDIDTLVSLKDFPMFQEYKVIFDSLEALKEITEDKPKSYKISYLPQNPSPDLQKYLNAFGLENKEYSWDEWQILANEMSNKIQNGDGIFKLGRRLGIEDLGIKKFDISIENINFNEKLRETKLGKSFSEVVESMMELLRKIPLANNFFMEYTMTYMMLNILGIDNEKNKKIKFKNVQTDSQHSFFGMYADYFVSSDKGLLLKSKFLYNIYGLKVKILSLEEFIKEFSFLSENFNDRISYTENLRYDISNGLIIGQKDSILTDTKQYKINLTKWYFSYFNTIEVYSNKQLDIITLCKYRGNMIDFISFKEFENVVNLSSNLFGLDENGRQEFDTIDLEELNSMTWVGRKWSYPGVSYELKYLSDINKFVFMNYLFH